MTDEQLAKALEEHADDVEGDGYPTAAERMREAAKRLRARAKAPKKKGGDR